MREVSRLISNEHVIEIKPREGGDWASVVRQMCDEAVLRRCRDVKH